ncbi:hypothetical protein ACFP2T_18500 [Plantactinospora solaniradicis]|uniref:Exo-alpha-sialidase n=1 Tax=Plantactinospora solaniradicis TaxID=1723736 RepID=A0ABW1KA79_9ACTN
MRKPHFDGLRAYADDAIRQPDFAVIRQRATRVRRHRRRAAASSVAALVTALFATSLGYATAGGPQVPLPTPSISVDPDTGWPRVTSVVATGATDLYALVQRCRACPLELYASDDVGATWQRRSVPPAPDDDSGEPRAATIASVGRGALAWRDIRAVNLHDLEYWRSPQASPTGPADSTRSASVTEPPWTTIDGGRTWHRAKVDPKPVAAVPPGTRPVDCHLVGQPTPCRIYAMDLVSGRIAALARQPSGITFDQTWAGDTSVPLGAHLWVPGRDPATDRPAVASSSDGGRTWHTHVFTDGVPAVADHGTVAGKYLPEVAAGAGGTAYALIYRDGHGRDSYRTTDGGATWRPVPGGALAGVSTSGFVTADGAHIVTSGHNLSSGQEFRGSRNGGRYQPVTLPGYPADLMLSQLTSHQAAGRYLVLSESHLYLSDDGWTWRRVDLP